MKAYTHEVDQKEVVLDLDIRWVTAHFLLLEHPHRWPGCAVHPPSYLGDADIDALVKEPITAGIKGLKVGISVTKSRVLVDVCQRWTLLCWIFQLTGMLRVILEPLIGVAPLVGGVTFFFIRRPVSSGRSRCHLIISSCSSNVLFVCFSKELEINWTGATNLLDSPAFRWVSSGNLSWVNRCKAAPPCLQFLVWRRHHGHHRLSHGVAQPHVCAPHWPGQSGPDAIPATSCKTGFSFQFDSFD